MEVPLFILTITLPCATVLMVFAMRYYSAIQQAKARLANDDAYRQIAQTAASAQSTAALSLTAIQAAISDIQTRLTGVEKLLRDVG